MKSFSTKEKAKACVEKYSKELEKALVEYYSTFKAYKVEVK